MTSPDPTRGEDPERIDPASEPDRAGGPVTDVGVVDRDHTSEENDADAKEEKDDDDDDDATVSGIRGARRRRSGRRNAMEWAFVIVGALVVAFLIKSFLFQAFYIPTGSMEPTLNVGDRVLVNKLSYRLHDVHRGDLVVFERPPNAAAGGVDDLIKRVVALPGEEVEARDGVVLVNGEKLDEPYLPHGTTTPDFSPVTVPEDHVFVLGDNRSNSQASNQFGPIDEDLIVGRAFVRVWPIGDIGGI